MRIVHFIATNFVGGPERQILNHVGRLPNDQHAALLISFAEHGGFELQAEAEKRGFQCVLLPAQKWQLHQVMEQLLRLYDEWKPDVVCAHGYKSGFYTMLLKWRRGCKFVAFSRGWTSENFKIHLYSLLDKTIVRFADAIVAVSKSQQQRLIEAWVPAIRIHVVENAVTVSVQRDEDIVVDPDKGIRKELGLPSTSRLILAAGRLSPEKGYDDLLSAMRDVSISVPDAHLLIAGSGMLDAALRQQARDQGIAERVHFLGFRKDMLQLYRQADVFALSSLSEGMPNVVLESMALGLPVVATRVGGLPEIIDDCRTGLLVDARAVKALAGGLTRMLTETEFARSTAKQAREDVYTRFNPEVQTERLLAVYREAMQA